MNGKQGSSRLRELVLAGVFAGVVAALGVVPPIYLGFTPVPITLQTLGVMLAGSLLGSRGGGLALLVFVLLVAAGAPVLAGGRGGAAILVGPTGGYILSWPVAAYVTGWIGERLGRARFWGYLLANVAGGIVVVHAVGAPFMAAVTGRTLAEALVGGSLVFLPGDLLKALLASAAALAVRARYPADRGHTSGRAA